MGRSSKLLFAVGVVAAVWSASDARVDAYATIGYKWNTNRVSYYVNPQSVWLTQTQALTAVRAAADVWHTQSNANVRLEYAGTTTGTALTLNYKNEVFFRNEASPSGATASTYWWYSGGSLVDADIVFWENHRWFSSDLACANGYYVENTGAHEFGHALGLAHSSLSEATMWGSTTTCMTAKQTLDGDDIAGIEALYPPSASPTVQPPAAPAQLTAAPASSDPATRLAVSWTASTGAEGYRLERSADGQSFAEIAQVGGGTLSYTNTGLASSTTYFYRVRAFNSAGSSGYSSVASGTTQAAPAPSPSPSPSPTAPAAPTGLTVVPGAAAPSSSLTVSWAASAGADGYRIERSQNGKSYSQVAQVGGSVLSFTNTGLAASTTYYYRVRAFNSVGTSPYSAVVSGRTQASTTETTAPAKGKPGKK
jgi:hypothetical protein